MKRLKADISYTFETIEFGARVRIATANAEAVEAIHGFLRYQIKDHHTGDSVEAEKQAQSEVAILASQWKEPAPFPVHRARPISKNQTLNLGAAFA